MKNKWITLGSILFCSWTVSLAACAHNRSKVDDKDITSVSVYFTRWDFDYFTPPSVIAIRMAAVHQSKLLNKLGYIDNFLNEYSHLKCRPRPNGYNIADGAMVVDIMSNDQIDHTLLLDKYAIIISGHGDDLLCEYSSRLVESLRIPLPNKGDGGN